MSRVKRIKTTFQLKRGTDEAWKFNNPILAKGEPGFVLDKNKLKIGDGITEWNKLPYLEGDIDFIIEEPHTGQALIYKEDDSSWHNIDLSNVAFSGLYQDLSDKPIYCGTTAYWREHLDFIGNEGDIIIYSDYKTISQGGETKTVAGIKVSDGKAYAIDQPFITSCIENTLQEHINDKEIHITQSERLSWNNKITTTSEAVGETLILTRD